MDRTERFFWHDVPAMIAREPQAFQALSGSIAFSCGGKKVTLMLGDVEQPVVAGFDRTASLRLWFFKDAFERFLDGAPLQDRRDHLHQGDASVLSRLGRFLSAGQNPLSVRFQTL
jgi:hypothetical protein